MERVLGIKVGIEVGRSDASVASVAIMVGSEEGRSLGIVLDSGVGIIVGILLGNKVGKGLRLVVSGGAAVTDGDDEGSKFGSVGDNDNEKGGVGIGGLDRMMEDGAKDGDEESLSSSVPATTPSDFSP